jgi:transcriptional regulator with XRE-family HTH domain
MGTRGVSLSGDAARRIRDTLTEQGLSNAEIARKLGMHRDTISRTLNAKPQDRKTLNPILQYLINIDVVCLEKGQTLESLLAKKPEPSYKVPNAAQDITEGCMGSSSQSLSAFALAVVQQAQEWVKS